MSDEGARQGAHATCYSTTNPATITASAGPREAAV
jgi:hypothetical protein